MCGAQFCNFAENLPLTRYGQTETVNDATGFWDDCFGDVGQGVIFHYFHQEGRFLEHVVWGPTSQTWTHRWLVGHLGRFFFELDSGEGSVSHWMHVPRCVRNVD